MASKGKSWSGLKSSAKCRAAGRGCQQDGQWRTKEALHALCDLLKGLLLRAPQIAADLHNTALRSYTYTQRKGGRGRRTSGFGKPMQLSSPAAPSRLAGGLLTAQVCAQWPAVSRCASSTARRIACPSSTPHQSCKCPPKPTWCASEQAPSGAPRHPAHLQASSAALDPLQHAYNAPFTGEGGCSKQYSMVPTDVYSFTPKQGLLTR